MSLINRMLSDLESRRGGNLRNVDSVIDGLQPSEAIARGAAPKRRKPPLLAGVAVAACVGVALVWQPWKTGGRAAAPEVAAPVPAPAPAPASAAPSPVPSAGSDPVAAAPAGSVPVLIADPPAAANPPAVATAPEPADAPPAPPVAATSEAPEPPAPAPQAEAAPPPPPPAEPEPAAVASETPAPAPERASAPAPERASTPAPRRQQNEESSFVIANASAPAQTAELALALIDSGRPEEAEALLREGLAVQPDDSDAARVLGHLLLGQGDARAALEVLSAAAPSIEVDPGYHALMAAAEQRSAAHGAAVRRYRELLGLQPGNGQWLVGLGISLLASGDGAGAADAFREALTDPALPPALRSFAMQQAATAAEGSP